MKKIIFLLSVLFLSACGKTYTVDDFTKDKELLNTFNKKCNNGELHPHDLNCVNVKKAKAKVHHIEW